MHGAFRLRRSVLMQRVFTRNRMLPQFFLLSAMLRPLNRTSVDPSDDAHSRTVGKPSFQSGLTQGVSRTASWSPWSST